MDYAAYLQFLLALIVVLGIILGLAWLARRFGMGGAPMGTRRRRRLALMETLAIDGKRRLVLVRRDDREHLLLIGGASDLVVETGLPAQEPGPQGPAEGGAP